MRYIITTQITESYYEASKSLFNTIKKHWKDRFVVGFVDFIPADYDGEYYLMKREDIGTYRTDYPKNRSDFVCPQSGEFIDYLDCEEDDVIIQIDADSIIQRELTDVELLNLIPEENQFITVYGANPPNNLYGVAKNLGFVNPEDFKHLEHLPEITPSFIVGKKKTFIDLRDAILTEWDEFIKINFHHAGIQWITSKIIHENFKLKVVDNVYQCGDWYLTFNLSVRNYKLFLNNNIVIFNHTKFNDNKYFNNEIVPCWDIKLGV